MSTCNRQYIRNMESGLKKQSKKKHRLTQRFILVIPLLTDEDRVMTSILPEVSLLFRQDLPKMCIMISGHPPPPYGGGGAAMKINVCSLEFIRRTLFTKGFFLNSIASRLNSNFRFISGLGTPTHDWSKLLNAIKEWGCYGVADLEKHDHLSCVLSLLRSNKWLLQTREIEFSFRT